jgi:hypothetical protein
MKRTMAILVTAVALLAVAAGPVAAAEEASNAPTIVTEPIDDHNVHEEPDGSRTEFHTVGTRTTFLFPSGRTHTTEAYTMRQVLTDASGTLLFTSESTTTQHVIFEGERTIFFSTDAHTVISYPDGSACTITLDMVVANDKMVRFEQIGPICD